MDMLNNQRVTTKNADWIEFHQQKWGGESMKCGGSETNILRGYNGMYIMMLITSVNLIMIHHQFARNEWDSNPQKLEMYFDLSRLYAFDVEVTLLRLNVVSQNDHL
jgi:hypothetical protein